MVRSVFFVNLTATHVIFVTKKKSVFFNVSYRRRPIQVSYHKRRQVSRYKFTITIKTRPVSWNSSKTLSERFSIDSFFTVLTKLSNMKVLSLVSLGLWGPLPSKISRFKSLEVFNISSNVSC